MFILSQVKLCFRQASIWRIAAPELNCQPELGLFAKMIAKHSRAHMCPGEEFNLTFNNKFTIVPKSVFLFNNLNTEV